MEQLKSWLKERHQLAVAVYSTGAADAILARHGLSIVDFLRPLSLVNQLNGARQHCSSLQQRATAEFATVCLIGCSACSLQPHCLQDRGWGHNHMLQENFVFGEPLSSGALDSHLMYMCRAALKLCCRCRCHCCVLLSVAVPMRVGEFSMRVQEVKLSLFAGNSMYQPKPEVRNCLCGADKDCIDSASTCSVKCTGICRQASSAAGYRHCMLVAVAADTTSVLSRFAVCASNFAKSLCLTTAAAATARELAMTSFHICNTLVSRCFQAFHQQQQPHYRLPFTAFMQMV